VFFLPNRELTDHPSRRSSRQLCRKRISFSKELEDGDDVRKSGVPPALPPAKPGRRRKTIVALPLPSLGKKTTSSAAKKFIRNDAVVYAQKASSGKVVVRPRTRKKVVVEMKSPVEVKKFRKKKETMFSLSPRSKRTDMRMLTSTSNTTTITKKDISDPRKDGDNAAAATTTAQARGNKSSAANPFAGGGIDATVTQSDLQTHLVQTETVLSRAQSDLTETKAYLTISERKVVEPQASNNHCMSLVSVTHIENVALHFQTHQNNKPDDDVIENDVDQDHKSHLDEIILNSEGREDIANEF